VPRPELILVLPNDQDKNIFRYTSTTSPDVPLGVVDAEQQRVHRAFVHNDPLELLRPGSRIESLCLAIPPPEGAGAVPAIVNNWDFFEGSLLAVGFKGEGDVLKIEATAVMIGPGLAISAKHVLDDHLEALREGGEFLYAVGVHPGGRADVWRLQHFRSSGDGGDLAILSLALVSDLPTGGRFTCVPMTARRPLSGEHLTIVGFRFNDDENLMDPATSAVTVTGHMFVAAGEMAEFYWALRDRVGAPFPCFDILCGSHGGMSGGAVLDKDGCLVGVISRGFSAADGKGPSLGAWCVPVFGWHVTASWPTNFYPTGTPIAAIPVVRIRAREKLTVNDDGTVQLRSSGD
jgi:hypothetical protein